MKLLRATGSMFVASLLLACASASPTVVGDQPDGGTAGNPTPGTDSGTPGDPGTLGSDAAGPGPGPGPGTDAAPGTDGSTPGKLTTVFTILMENHDYNEIVGSPNAPYFNSLIADYGLATNYMDSLTHPSLPNYLMMVSGTTQGVSSDLNPTAAPFPVASANLGSQLQTAGIAWRAYQESMGTACKLTASGGYAPKHDPFLYFTDIQTGAGGLCAKTNVDYTSFPADLTAGTYRFTWITPNLTNDGHDPAANPVAGLKASDAWAKIEIPKIMASPAYVNGGVIFLTWDEGEGRAGNSKDQVPMIVISTKIASKGFKSAKAYSHKSYLATVEDILGLPRLDTVKNEPNMMEFFQ